LRVLVEGASEPLGFIEIDENTTLSEVRNMIITELEDFPAEFRFLANVENSFVKISLNQGKLVFFLSLFFFKILFYSFYLKNKTKYQLELKKKAKEFLPVVTIKGI
jgi:hypothetical protein